MNILYCTTTYPAHKRNGGDIGTQKYIDALRATGARVDVLSYLRPTDKPPTREDEHIVEVRVNESTDSLRQTALWIAYSLFKGLPYSAGKFHAAVYIDAVRKLTAQRPYDLCVIDHTSRLHWLLPHFPKGSCCVAVSHNIEHALYAKNRDNATNPLKRALFAREARLVKAAEDQLARQASEVWCVTTDDAEYYASVSGACRARGFDTPPGEDAVPPVVRPAKRFDIALLGNWQWVANSEGLKWFVRDILPLLPSTLSIEIAGKGSDLLTNLPPNVKARGFVPDAWVFLHEAKVIAIPSISGAGVQIKSLDALAQGLPVVANGYALRGIRTLPDTVTVAESAADFAQALIAAAAKPYDPGTEAAALTWAEGLRQRYVAGIAEALQAVTHPHAKETR